MENKYCTIWKNYILDMLQSFPYIANFFYT